MAARTKPQLTEAEAREQSEAWEGYYQEALAEPMGYTKHDSNAHENDQLRRGVSRYGFAFSGMWWLLCELLSSRKHHLYDVSDDEGWEFFARDMSSAGRVVSVDECREFVARLLELGLIAAEPWEGRHIVNERICRNAHEYAMSSAARQMGAWKANRAKRQA